MELVVWYEPIFFFFSVGCFFLRLRIFIALLRLFIDFFFCSIMVERYIAKLRMTNEEVPFWSAKFPGISISWLEWLGPKKDQVVAEFIASDVQVEQQHRFGYNQIRHKVLDTFRGRVIDDDLKTWHNSPARALTVYSVINNPQLVGKGQPREVKQAAEAATDLKEIELTKAQYDAYCKQVGQEIEPKEVRQKPIERMVTTPDGKQQRVVERTEDVYVLTQGIIDSG